MLEIYPMDSLDKIFSTLLNQTLTLCLCSLLCLSLILLQNNFNDLVVEIHGLICNHL